MTETQIIDSVVSNPRVRRLTLPLNQGGNAIPANEIRSSVQGQLSQAILKVATAHPWDFATAEHTDSAGTVADQSDYTLKGSNSDARDIIGVKYDTDEDLLTKMNLADFEIYKWQRTIGSVVIWIPFGRSGGFPVIRLAATPDTAGKQIKYLYRRKNITFQMFPDEFQFVLQDALIAWIDPSHMPAYEDSLNQMKDEYSGGGIWEESVAPVDRHRILLNNRRSQLQGYTGEIA